MKNISVVVASLALSSAYLVSDSSAEIVFSFSPTPNGAGTIITADGDLDIRGLAQFGSHGIPQAVLDHDGDGDVFRSTPGLADSYRIGGEVALFNAPSEFHYSSNILDSSLVTGDEFGLTTGVDYLAIFVPRAFENGLISGQVTFIDAPLASLRVIEQEFTWGAGFDQRARIQVVPTPGVVLSIVAGASGLLCRRRR
ncbi:MAG: hypothetical protein H6810_08940 [Phycisphaeraceae bacterium]|nr:MAG: hypothetical protein H6810_08940 [Phycisphaeraceae bacterium]